MSNSDGIDVCLLLGSEQHQEKFTREIRTLLSETESRISLVLIDETTNNSERPEGKYTGFRLSYIPKFFSMLADKGPKTLIWAEAHLAGLLSEKKTPYERLRELETMKTHLDDIEGVAETERVYFTPEKVGKHTYEIPDEIVNRVVEETDVVILLGFNRILRGRILTEPTHGALSLHWSDIRKYRGRPGCFWQFMNGEDTIGLTLQQLNEELDGGNLIACRHADITEAKTWFEVRLRAAQLYGPMLAEGVQKLQDPDYKPKALKGDELGEMTYESDGYKLMNVFRMIGKNVYGRLFG